MIETGLRYNTPMTMLSTLPFLDGINCLRIIRFQVVFECNSAYAGTSFLSPSCITLISISNEKHRFKLCSLWRSSRRTRLEMNSIWKNITFAYITQARSSTKVKGSFMTDIYDFLSDRSFMFMIVSFFGHLPRYHQHQQPTTSSWLPSMCGAKDNEPFVHFEVWMKSWMTWKLKSRYHSMSEVLYGVNILLVGLLSWFDMDWNKVFDMFLLLGMILD